jgi:hypothetical protein
MNNALIPYNEVEQFGKAMVASGYFSDVRQISQAVVKIQAGAEIGLPPFASMSGIHIIQGKPVLGANLLATLIKNDVRYDYRIVELTNDNCVIAFYENGEVVGNSTFSADDAKKASVKNMNKFPRNMLFARAISNGAKWFTPGIFGGMPVYTPDELGLEVNHEGDVIQGEVIEKPERDNRGLDQLNSDLFGDGESVDEPATWDELKSKEQTKTKSSVNEKGGKPVGAADFAIQFADSHSYYTDNFHVIGALKKVTGDENIGVTFNNYSFDELTTKLEDYANREADES